MSLDDSLVQSLLERLEEGKKDLEEQGIVVVSRKIGRAKLYKINLQHPLVKALREHDKRLSLQEAEKERAGKTVVIT